MQALLYETGSSRARQVNLEAEGEDLVIHAPDGEMRYGFAVLRIAPRLGNTPRFIHLPDGRICECADNDALDGLLAERGEAGASRLLHQLETRGKYLLGALAVTALFVYLFTAYALPSIAKRVAEAIPASAVYSIGHGTLAQLDKGLFEPTRLPLERQKELTRIFMEYVSAARDWPRVNVVFRSGPLGPNALALPDGTIVFTDDLVKLARDDRELLGIFFHEMGHVERRHALRSVLQDSAFFLLISAVTGDATSAGSLLAALPTMLVESRYSRDMEIEADTHAYEMMSRNRIAHGYYADILERLLEVMPPEEDSAMRYLRSHPLTLSRIQRFRQSE